MDRNFLDCLTIMTLGKSTKLYLTVINHLNIASIKQLHEKAVYWKIQGLKIRFGQWANFEAIY